MGVDTFEIESKRPFSESLIWQFNRDFYLNNGIAAWGNGIVPHSMTSSSKVGKTYAELIFALLKDLAHQGNIDEVIYLLELGAGHGRLAFHILQHLEKLIESVDQKLPPYCYVLSDIVEENLTFFSQHPQFEVYIEEGKLDVTYFDAIESDKIYLRNKKQSILTQELNQPIITIANYFFDSIPNELLHFENRIVSSCSIAINSEENPKDLVGDELLKIMDFSYFDIVQNAPFYKESLLNEIVEEYRNSFADTYLFFPKKGLECIQHIQSFSKVGMVLLSMDKGFHELMSLRGKKEPEIIKHGSISLWVNYHALGAYCSKQGGLALFSTSSNFHLEIGCLMFLKDAERYRHTNAAYEEFVNSFGPDDFNSMKQLAYTNAAKLQLKELIALYRLSNYDSGFFVKLLPRLKQVSKTISFQERNRLDQTMAAVWKMYFNIDEQFDLAYEIGGLYYDLGFYPEALRFFGFSVEAFGVKPDMYYNKALCYYQLHKDELFYETLNEAKLAFPDYELFQKLDSLDMN